MVRTTRRLTCLYESREDFDPRRSLQPKVLPDNVECASHAFRRLLLIIVFLLLLHSPVLFCGFRVGVGQRMPL